MELTPVADACVYCRVTLAPGVATNMVLPCFLAILFPGLLAIVLLIEDADGSKYYTTLQPCEHAVDTIIIVQILSS